MVFPSMEDVCGLGGGGGAGLGGRGGDGRNVLDSLIV